MNSFEAAGEAQLQAQEGQMQVAAALAKELGRLASALMARLNRHAATREFL